MREKDHEIHESIIETRALLSNRKLAKALRKSIKEAREDKLIPIEEVETDEPTPPAVEVEA